MFLFKILLCPLLLSLPSPGRALVTPSSQIVTRQSHPHSGSEAKALSMSLGGRPATWIITSIVGGTIGTPFVAKATNTWYRKINLPDWTPPDRVFPIVWTILYSFMGYSAYKVYQATNLCSPQMKLALFHYALNISWAPIFFGMKRLRVGHGLNLLLIATLLAIIPSFYRINPISGLLLVPYLIWLVFAAKLSDSICKLNPTVKGYNNAMLEADICKLQEEAAARVGL